jgi:hypothetical protein
MNSRERILAAINRQTLDGVPTDSWATPGGVGQTPGPVRQGGAGPAGLAH